MKVGRQYLGKRVEVVWRDPCSANVKSHARDHTDVPKGREVLATQREQGIITDITDGVVRLEHTRGEDSPLVPEPTTDFSLTWVDEALIESIVVYEPTAKVPGE